MPNTYYRVIKIICETEEQADRVIAERIEHDEDYGFYYEIESVYVDPDALDELLLS